jgi:hypothetical protein
MQRVQGYLRLAQVSLRQAQVLADKRHVLPREKWHDNGENHDAKRRFAWYVYTAGIQVVSEEIEKLAQEQVARARAGHSELAGEFALTARIEALKKTLAKLIDLRRHRHLQQHYAADPVLVLPTEVTQAILSYLDIYELW